MTNAAANWPASDTPDSGTPPFNWTPGCEHVPTAWATYLEIPTPVPPYPSGGVYAAVFRERGQGRLSGIPSPTSPAKSAYFYLGFDRLYDPNGWNTQGDGPPTSAVYPGTGATTYWTNVAMAAGDSFATTAGYCGTTAVAPTNVNNGAGITGWECDTTQHGTVGLWGFVVWNVVYG